MAFLGWQRRSAESDVSTLKEPTSWFMRAFGASMSETGTLVSEESAMRFMAVFACVRVLATTGAFLPAQLYRRTGSGKELADNHYLYKLIHKQPREGLTSYKLREWIMRCLLLNGNAYVLPLRDNRGRIGEFQELNRGDVNVYEYQKKLFYKVDGYSLPFTESDIIHIRYMGDGKMGLSPIGYQRETIGAGIAARSYNSKFYAQGAHVPGYLTTDGALKPDQREHIKGQWKQKHAGLDGAFSTPLLEGGLEYKTISIPQKDAQFLEMMKFNRTEIAGMYGVPPHLIADLERATFSNIEHQDLAYVKYALGPLLANIEQEFNSKIFRYDENSYFMEHNMNALLRADVKSRGEFYAKMFSSGVFTHNQILSLENMNGYEGGDRRYVPVNMVPTDRIDDMIDNNQNTNEEPSEEAA